MMSSDRGDITALLHDAREGSTAAEAKLAKLIYAELRHLAAIRMKSERSGHTLTPTALANEAWLRIAPDVSERAIEDRHHFFKLGPEEQWNGKPG